MKILIVEDDTFLETLVTRKFVSSGIEVVGVSNGEEVLPHMVSDRPDVVLLDIMLPGIDGFEVLKRARENASVSTIPVIVFSNFADEKKMTEALALGAKAYLIKSNFTLDELLKKIIEILKNSPIKNVDTFFKDLTD